MPEGTLLSRELFLRSFLGGAATASAPSLDGLSRVLQEVELHAGDVLFREGALSDRLYFLENGRVRLSREGHKPYVLAGGWIIGRVDVLADRPRRRTATILTDAKVLSVRREDWFDWVEDTLELARDVMGEQMNAAAEDYARLAPEPFAPPWPSPPIPSEPLTLFDRVLAFFDSPVFRKAGVQNLATMAEAAVEVRLAAGEELIVEGAPRDHLYVVAHGCVETTHFSPVPMKGQFGRASFVGGVAARSITWSARATEPSVVLALALEDWFEALSLFDLVRCTMAWIGLEAERINETLAERAEEELVLEEAGMLAR